MDEKRLLANGRSADIGSRTTFDVQPRQSPRHFVVSASTIHYPLSTIHYPLQFPTALHSHSIVAGGLLEISYTTRLTPSTSLTIRLLTRANNA